MKIRFLFYMSLFFALIACKKQETNKINNTTVDVTIFEEIGSQIFEANNCSACHKIDEKVVGPSLESIAKMYKGKKGGLVSFLKGETNPLVDPSQYQTMKINLELTKSMTDDELKSIEIYIQSQEK